MSNNVFDYVNSLSYSKKYLDEELSESGYVPYIVNKAFSQYPDCILYANEMNQLAHLDKKLQFDFYFHGIRPRKRFAKWHKPVDNAKVTLLQEYYKCNKARAEEALALLTDEQYQQIEDIMQRR